VYWIQLAQGNIKVDLKHTERVGLASIQLAQNIIKIHLKDRRRE
jgi:hypothetical protein